MSGTIAPLPFNCCMLRSGERLSNVYVGVTLEAPGTPVRGNYPLCATHPGTVGAYWELACQTPMRGRYIIVQLATTDQILTVSELQVFRGVPGTWECS